MAETKYIIGDTVQLKATIKNFAGAELNPGSTGITVSVYQLDGTSLLSSGVPTWSTGTTAQYYYNWKVSTGLTSDERLAVVWNWKGPHKKKMMMNVIPIL